MTHGMIDCVTMFGFRKTANEQRLSDCIYFLSLIALSVWSDPKIILI